MTTPIDHSAMRLGKGLPKLDDRTLKMAAYVGAALPPFPSSVTWSAGVSGFGMYRNDQYGDCTCASAGNLIRSWTQETGEEIDVTDDDVLAAYAAITGFTADDPTTDNGAVELDVLRYWRNTGIAGHRIGAFTSIQPHRIDHVRLGIWLFGGIYTGFALPITAQTQDAWDVVPGGSGRDSEPNSWGGHAIPLLDYADGFSCVTWGGLKKMTEAFVRTYCDEAYALLSRDWLMGGKSPSGFDLIALNNDLRAL